MKDYMGDQQIHYRIIPATANFTKEKLKMPQTHNIRVMSKIILEGESEIAPTRTLITKV